MVDIFFYSGSLREDSTARLQQKLSKLPLSKEAAARRLADLKENRKYHATAVQKIIDEQLEPIAAQQINLGGGGRTVLDSVLKLVFRLCET